MAFSHFVVVTSFPILLADRQEVLETRMQAVPLVTTSRLASILQAPNQDRKPLVTATSIELNWDEWTPTRFCVPSWTRLRTSGLSAVEDLIAELETLVTPLLSVWPNLIWLFDSAPGRESRSRSDCDH